MDRARLGDRVKNRRIGLGWSVTRAARAAGINRVTWRAVEDGSRATESYTFGPIERVLGWAQGSAEAVLAGGEPTVTDAAASAEAAAEEEKTTTAEEIVVMVVQILRSTVNNDMKVRLLERLMADEYQPGDAGQLRTGHQRVAG